MNNSIISKITSDFSKYSGLLALFFCGVIGLVISIVIPVSIEDKPVVDVAKGEEEVPVNENELREVDLDSLITFCVSNTTKDRGFVIFENGSCVLIPEPCDDPVGFAESVLNAAGKEDARFLSEENAEGDLIVTFESNLFHRTPAEELVEMKLWSLTHFEGFLSGLEKESADPGWIPPANARLGLIGRSRLLVDVAEMKVVKILRPNASVD